MLENKTTLLCTLSAQLSHRFRMSITPGEYDKTKLAISKPEKHINEGTENCTLTIKYAGKDFQYYVPDACVGTPLSENPKKPGQLTQGWNVDTPAWRAMLEDVSRQCLQAVVDNRMADGMPKFIRGMDSIEKIMTAKTMGIHVKTVIHFPEKQDSQGHPTGVIDPDATPKAYVRMIQNGKNPKKGVPNQVWTNFRSALVLRPDIAEKIAKGIEKDEKYSFDAWKMHKAQQAMKGMPSITISDIYVADGNIIIRQSLSECFITEFTTKESQARKNLRSDIVRNGREITGPTMLPDAPPPPEEGGVNNTNVQELTFTANPSGGKGSEPFTVEVIQ